MIIVHLTETEKVKVDAAPENVTTESGVLTIRSGKTIVGRFRRFVAWYEDTSTTDTTD